jgi:CRP-like cAMP-binding protein
MSVADEIALTYERLAGRRPVRVKVAANAALFRAGDPIVSLYVIVAGKLRLVRASETGREVTLYRSSAGAAFAEASLFSERYYCDAVADTPSVVLAFPKSALLKGLREQPAHALALMRHLAMQVQAGRALAEILNIRSASARLLAYLRLSEPAHSDIFDIGRSWKQLAGEIGLTHEALYRALAKLEKDGSIERKGSKVRLLE